MRLEFQYTADDFAEAQRHHQQALLAPNVRNWGVWVSLAAMAVTVIAYLVVASTWGPATAVDEPPDPLVTYVLLPLIPWALILANGSVVLWLKGRPRVKEIYPWKGAHATVARPVPATRAPWAGTFKRLIAPPLYLAMYVLMFAAGQYPWIGRRVWGGPMWVTTYPNTAGLWAVPMIFWTVYQAWAVITNSVNARSAFSNAWKRHTHLHWPIRMEFTVAGATLEGPASHSEYRWEYFRGFRETPALFLIYVSPTMFHMVPKRAFASEDEQTAFRHMLVNLIGRRPAAFPVLPAAAEGSATI